MIGMPYTAERTQYSQSVFKIQLMQLQQVNIFLPYFAVLLMHGFTLAAYIFCNCEIGSITVRDDPGLNDQLPVLYFNRSHRFEIMLCCADNG